jgi:GT2 family glycosyltransferase
VGPLLLFPDNTIQHAGVILGANGAADRPYLGYRRGYAGIAGRAQAAQNVTALITACAAVRRDRYEEVGGMDESLAVSHNDLDLCLRLMEKGYRNVWTPHAELYHHESASRGYDNSPALQDTARAEEARFRARWGRLLVLDANYNVNLADNGQLFSLAFPPRVPT